MPVYILFFFFFGSSVRVKCNANVLSRNTADGEYRRCSLALWEELCEWFLNTLPSWDKFTIANSYF